MLEDLSRIDFVAKKGKAKIPCYEANEKEKDIFKCVELNKKQIGNHFLEYGGILLRNFDIRSVSEFNRLANIISTNLLDYVNRSTPRTKLGDKIYTATEYPADRPIPFHNENSYTLEWPNKILFFSVIAAEEGGETVIAKAK